MTPQELRTHLKRLVWCGKLHRLLRSGELRLPWADLLFVLHFFFYVAAGIHIWRMARAARLSGLPAQPGDIVWLIALVLCGVALRLGWRSARSPEERIKARLRSNGVLAPATIVQVNSAYFDPANHDPRPASLLLSFDPRAELELDKLDRAGDRVRSLKFADRSQLPRAHADIAWRLYHEMVEIPSYPVPEELTEGLEHCWVVGTSIARDDFGAGRAHGGILFVLALPGATSPHAVTTIPRAVWDHPTPSWVKAFFWRWCVPRAVR